MNSKLYYIGLGLALSAVLWGTMVLVLMPFAYGSEFGSSTITNSTTTAPPNAESLPTNATTWSATAASEPPFQSRETSDYLRLGIVLSIVLVAVLASIAYFRRKK